MNITPAESRILHLISSHGKADRDLSNPSLWSWKVNGEARKAMSRPVDSLIRKGFLAVSEDRSTATLTTLGNRAIQEREAA